MHFFKVNLNIYYLVVIRKFTMSSQVSTTSSISTDIFNENFVSELNEVDILYFANNECQQYEISYNNSGSGSESDSDSGVSLN